VVHGNNPKRYAASSRATDSPPPSATKPSSRVQRAASGNGSLSPRSRTGHESGALKDILQWRSGGHFIPLENTVESGRRLAYGFLTGRSGGLDAGGIMTGTMFIIFGIGCAIPAAFIYVLHGYLKDLK